MSWTSTAFIAYAGAGLSLGADARANLENCKTGLEELISDTSGRVEQIAKLAHFFPAVYNNFYSNFGQLQVVDPNSLSPAMPQPIADGVSLVWPQQIESYRINVGPPPPAMNGWFGHSGIQIVDGRYTVSASGDDLINCLMSPELVSAFYPLGYSALFGTDAAILSPFVFLPCFLLLREISEYQELLALVVVAIATLFSRLDLSGISHAIAVSQRSFFTHHGAHPPESGYQRHLGSFSGRVFEPQVAA